MNQNVGEASISPQVQQTVAPDITSPQGQQQLIGKAVAASQTKNLLDGVFKIIAQKTGSEFDSRVKQIQTAAAKVAQKRLENRKYDISDINDMAGFRFTSPSKAQFPAIKKAIESLADAGLFKIAKREDVKSGTYSGYHLDIKLPNNEGGEIQIHTIKSKAESVVNHDLRALAGQSPDGSVKMLRDTQAKMINKMPDKMASSLSSAMEQMRYQNNNRPLDPRMTAGMIASMSK